MAESYSSKLQVWEGWAPALVRGPFPAVPGERPASGLRPANDLADRLFTAEALHPGGKPREGDEPWTLQWYLNVEAERYGKYGRWIPRLLEFAKHGGERLLGLGNGLGTDWVQYARHGAAVTICCPSAEHLAFVQRNYEVRGLSGQFLHADPEALPVEAASIDVACLTGLLPEVADPGAVVEEVYRVLKPGGKLLALTPARFDVQFWRERCLPWQRWFQGKGPAEIPKPGCSARGLRRLFARFVEPRISKRHLRRRDVPHLWRWLPHPLLERLLGRQLVLKAFKPLSAARTFPLAA
jgi:SAM-dependent methyltransferase